MHDDLAEVAPIDASLTARWSCPFCDTDNPRGGHELGLALDETEVELRCDYCERISIHTA